MHEWRTFGLLLGILGLYWIISSFACHLSSIPK